MEALCGRIAPGDSGARRGAAQRSEGARPPLSSFPWRALRLHPPVAMFRKEPAAKESATRFEKKRSFEIGFGAVMRRI